MPYIITQSEDDVVLDINTFDAMIDEEKEKLYVFEHYEDAVAYLMCHGIRCLLYTSPSPRDLSTSRMPSSA